MKRISTCWKDRNGFHAALELKDLSLNNFIAQAEGEEAHPLRMAMFTKSAAKAQAAGQRQNPLWRIYLIFQRIICNQSHV